MTKGLFRAYVDGGAFPNPNGKMGVGVVLYDPQGNLIDELSECPPKLGTNNEAEYIAVLRALQLGLEHKAEEIEVCADSSLTVNTLSGRWRLKAAHLLPLKKMIDAELKQYRSARMRWVPREDNKLADALATKAIGGTTGGKSKYGVTKKGAQGEPPAARPQAEGALCSACKKACTFEWQVFKNGTSHIRQVCPEHGFLRFAPKEHPYTEVAGTKPAGTKD